MLYIHWCFANWYLYLWYIYIYIYLYCIFVVWTTMWPSLKFQVDSYVLNGWGQEQSAILTCPKNVGQGPETYNLTALWGWAPGAVGWQIFGLGLRFKRCPRGFLFIVIMLSMDVWKLLIFFFFFCEHWMDLGKTLNWGRAETGGS